MSIIKYVGIYLLAGIVIHMGWTILFEVWIRAKVGGEKFPEAMDYYLGLKLRLYDEHAGLREAKIVMEHILSKGAAGIVAWIALTMVIWPTAVYEDFAVYSDMVNYVMDVTEEKGEP